MRKAKLFKNGKSQAVRLPKEFSFLGQEVYIKKYGHSTMLIPTDTAWDDWENSLNMFSYDFLPECNQPQQQGRESFDFFTEPDQNQPCSGK